MGTMRRAVAGLTTFVVAGSLFGCGDVARGPTGPGPLTGPLLSASTTITNVKVPFAQLAFVPCANNGAGELVLISGTLHVLLHQTISDAGHAQFKFHFQPQGASGVGLTTGDTYRATGVTQQTVTVDLTDGAPFTQTFINNFRIIGQGRDNNLLVHQTIHFTVNANGEPTAAVVNTSVECR
jgi:hypothetical protein